MIDELEFKEINSHTKLEEVISFSRNKYYAIDHEIPTHLVLFLIQDKNNLKYSVQSVHKVSSCGFNDLCDNPLIENHMLAEYSYFYGTIKSNIKTFSKFLNDNLSSLHLAEMKENSTALEVQKSGWIIL